MNCILQVEHTLLPEAGGGQLPISVQPPYLVSMPILGHGIDLVETARIAEMLDRHEERFLDRVFTQAEQNYCNRNEKRRIEHFAGRFAAKEAVLKALGTGWRGGIAWTDVEVVLNGSGRPMVSLTGECERLAKQMAITRWHLSISHIETHAMASATAESE
jgi:holo-[acyl-carrier protein] synthase